MTPRFFTAAVLPFYLLAAGSVGGASATAQSGENDPSLIPVQGNVYMLATADGNSAVQIGNDGVLVVDTQTEQLAPKVIAAIRKLSSRPILWIVNTDHHPARAGGNEALPRLSATGTGQRTRIIAHEEVLNRMTASQPRVPQALWPNDEYFLPTKDFAFNDEPVIAYHAPAAHTSGDSIVMFRRSDVVVAGDLFTPGYYPKIDLENGGTVQGVIDGLNRILQLTVPLRYQEAGTYVIPGRGRLCDEADVVEYRDMVTIVRDRVREMIKQGMTLEQVVAAQPARDYDTEYAPDPEFVHAVYRSLSQAK